MNKIAFKKDAEECYLSLSSILHVNNFIDETKLKLHLEFCSNASSIQKNNFRRQETRTINKIRCFRSRENELKEWEFHKGDADPYPSIPHGHKICDSSIKLDVYLGCVYKKNRSDEIISRENIIQLWNDDKFRKFAIESVEHFVQSNFAIN